jgi:hypothetical protein
MPPGCTQDHIDRSAGCGEFDDHETMCEICGGFASDCECRERYCETLADWEVDEYLLEKGDI